MRRRLREGFSNDDWNPDGDSDRDISYADPKRTARLTQLYARLLEEVGEDPTRDGLVKTPVRAAKAIQFLTQGYQESVEEVVNGAIFDEEASDGMVIVRDIEFYSLCEHHLLPFYGKCHVAYLAHGRIIGLSKIPRIVDMYARRFQVQERLTSEIAHALERSIQPLGVAVVTEAMHMCMMIRGVEKQHSSTVASCVLGAFRDDAATRKEFFDLIHTHRIAP